MRPSLGLSGVVTGMLALLMYFAPRVKVSFFFWFIVSIGSIGLPACPLGLWYIGWDADLHFERPSPLSFRAQREISLRNSAT